MAPSLRGVHRRVVCEECGFAFAVGADEPTPDGKRLACPLCGAMEQALADFPPVAGDRVLVDRGAFLWREPRRFEPVALLSPWDGRQALVKRVAGLPGETVELRDGELWIDGRLLRKSPEQARLLRALVYDDAFRPRRDPAPRVWQVARAGAVWELAPGRWQYRPANAAGPRATGPPGENVDWVEYRHGRLLPGAERRVELNPVQDVLAYNQTTPIVAAHAVRDVGIDCTVRATGEGRLWLRARDGDLEFHCGVEYPAGRAELFLRGERLATAALAPAALELVEAGRGLEFEFAMVDRQVLLVVQEATVFCHPYLEAGDMQEGGKPPAPLPSALAIGAEGLDLEVVALRVFRDAYLATPRGLDPRAMVPAGAAGVRLGPDEFFVLGDNPAVSEDSRTWGSQAAVSAELLIGKPFAAIPAPLAAGRGPDWFQVPDFLSIHYIH